VYSRDNNNVIKIKLKKIFFPIAGWWFMPAIPETWEVKLGGSQSRSRLGESMRSYVKNE
jgi:hypothetical protein